MNKTLKSHKRRYVITGMCLIVLGIYLLYEASAFGAMLHDQALITFTRYPLTATLAWIGEFGGGLEYVFVVGFLSLVPLGFGLIIAGIFAVLVSQSRRSRE